MTDILAAGITCHKPFTPSEMVAMGAKIEAIEKPKAAERKGGRPQKKTDEKFTSVSKPPPVRDKVAKALGVSGPTYDKAKAVVAAAEKPDAPPEVIAAAKQMDVDGLQAGALEGRHHGLFFLVGLFTGTAARAADNSRSRAHVDVGTPAATAAASSSARSSIVTLI